MNEQCFRLVTAKVGRQSDCSHGAGTHGHPEYL